MRVYGYTHKTIPFLYIAGIEIRNDLAISDVIFLYFESILLMWVLPHIMLLSLYHSVRQRIHKYVICWSTPNKLWSVDWFKSE